MNRHLSTAGLVAFFAADAALAALALRPLGPATAEPAAAAARTVTSAPPKTPGTTSPTGAASTTSTLSSQSYTPAPLTRMIVATDAQRAWRSTSGTCSGGGALVQTTTDAGRTWSAVGAPARAVARIQPLSGGRGFVYAAGSDCTLRELTTTDAARSWSGPVPIIGGWARQPSDPRVVVTPRADSARPCGEREVTDLARSSAVRAVALCLDGRVRRTNDGGIAWSDASAVPGALALATRDEGGALVAYAAVTTSDCSGIAIARVGTSTGKKPTNIACLTSTGPSAAGGVSLSVVATAGWLAVGDQTWLAGPDLTSWKQA